MSFKSLFKFRITHHFIIFWLCLAAFIHNILMNGANNVVISSLQKEFYVTSRETGVYVSVYDVGSLISNIFVPVLGSKGSRPRWVAFGMLILFAGSMINIMPHFLRSQHSIYNSANQQHSLDTAGLVNANSDDGSLIQMCNFSISIDESILGSNRSTNIPISQRNDSLPRFNEHAHSQTILKVFALKHLLYLANLVNGFSSASLTSLAISYIEDIAPESIVSVYESIYFAIGALGVGVGFLVTSKFLNIYTDIDTADSLPQWLVPTHPNWIGAWWFPYLIFGIVSLVLAIIISTFPKTLQAQRDKERKRRAQNAEELANLNQPAGVKANGVSPNHNHASPTIVIEPPPSQSDDEPQQRSNSPAPGISDQRDRLKPRSRTMTQGSEILQFIEEAGSMLSVNKAGIYPLPRAVDPNDDENADGTASEQHRKETLLQILRKAYVLAKNPVYIFLILTASIEGLLQNSFLAFASLFIEYQYRLTSGGASLLLGLLCIPPLMLGGLFGGLVAKKLAGKLIPCLKFICFAVAFNIFIYMGFLFYCPEPAMIGNLHNSPVWQQKVANHSLEHPPSDQPICYSAAPDCNCDQRIFKPVCLQDSQDIIFQSSCLAGCLTYDDVKETYTDCSQDRCKGYFDEAKIDLYFGSNSTATTSDKPPRRATFVNGLCPSNSCVFRTIIAYTSIVLLMFMNALLYVPYLKVTVACADDKQMNSIILGVKQLSMNAFGTIPGPIIFGAVIDLTCSYWHTDSSERKVCKIYNNKNFSMAFALLGVGFKILALIFIVISLLCALRNERKKRNNAKS